MFKEQPPGIANAQAAQQAVEQTNAVLRSLHIKQDSLLHYYKWASQGFAGKFSKEQVEKLRQHPLIDHVVNDYYYRAIQTASPEEHKTTTSPAKVTMASSETIPWGVSRVGGPLDGTGKTAWVLDSGVDLDHPDLNVDVTRSTSFVNGYSADDGLGHGTYVAGILAAKNNTTDLAGVAAGATIVAVRVCDDGGGCYVSDAKAGVEYVAANSSSGDVVNMSIGWPTDVSLPDKDIPLTDLENSIIDAANNNGLYFAIATSNAKVHAQYDSPGRINNPYVYTVSAFRQGDEFVRAFDSDINKGSGYGNPPIDYSGPGENVPSLLIGGGWGMGYNGSGTEDGTSYAAPHIAGIILTFGEAIYNGTVSNDPDSNPDIIAAARPLSPTVTASVQNSSPRLDWSAVPDAANYSIERLFEDGSWTYLGTTSNTYYVDQSVGSQNLHVISSPPFDWEDFYTYRIRALPIIGNPSLPTLVYFSQGNCTGPGCAQ